MKAEELMIGDWVKLKDAQLGYIKFNGPTVKIEYIVPPNVYVRNYKGLLEDVKDEYLLPIPLTPEILEKNGWKPYIPENHLETVYTCQDISKAVADELYALWPYQDGSFYLLLRVDGKDMVRKDVHYVHQLQHALRLCEIKKEIEL